MFEKDQKDRCNDVFQYHNNSRQWEENENCHHQQHQEDFKIDQLNYTSPKNNNTHIAQSPVHRQQNVCIPEKIIFYFFLF